jgi:hypothetical protein
MLDLTTDLVGQACAVFLALAYPDGPGTVPAKKRLFQALPPGRPMPDFLTDSADARAVCQNITDPQGQLVGYAFRLGSAGFPHLKLQVKKVNHEGPNVWVFAVDTHDHFAPGAAGLPPDHPDVQAWARLQSANQRLKEKIERAWEQARLLTFNELLRRGLGKPAGPSP